METVEAMETAVDLTEAEVETTEVVTEVDIKVHLASTINQGLTFLLKWGLDQDSNNILNLGSLLCSHLMEWCLNQVSTLLCKSQHLKFKFHSWLLPKLKQLSSYQALRTLMKEGSLSVTPSSHQSRACTEKTPVKLLECFWMRPLSTLTNCWLILNTYLIRQEKLWLWSKLLSSLRIRSRSEWI